MKINIHSARKHKGIVLEDGGMLPVLIKILFNQTAVTIKNRKSLIVAF